VGLGGIADPTASSAEPDRSADLSDRWPAGTFAQRPGPTGSLNFYYATDTDQIWFDARRCGPNLGVLSPGEETAYWQRIEPQTVFRVENELRKDLLSGYAGLEGDGMVSAVYLSRFGLSLTRGLGAAKPPATGTQNLFFETDACTLFFIDQCDYFLAKDIVNFQFDFCIFR